MTHTYTVIFLDGGERMFKCNARTLKGLSKQIFGFITAKYTQNGGGA